jgi:hypothetical protein
MGHTQEPSTLDKINRPISTENGKQTEQQHLHSLRATKLLRDDRIGIAIHIGRTLL